MIGKACTLGCFSQWPALCRALSLVSGPCQAGQALLKALSALAGIRWIILTYTVHWLKIVMLIMTWEIHSIFGGFFCRKAARYKKNASNITIIIHVWIIIQPCQWFVYPSEELLITSHLTGPLGQVKGSELQKKSWINPGNLTQPSRLMGIHSSMFFEHPLARPCYTDTWDISMIKPAFVEFIFEG